MKIRGTDFVLFQVSDLAAAARFNREALGLLQEVYGEEWRWAEFNCGQVTLALHGGAIRSGENCTEVFRRNPAGWRIIQTHWSFSQPSQNP